MVLSPPHGAVGKGRSKGKKSSLREDAKLEEAWKELASWRFSQGLRRISRSTLLKSKRRPGAKARKANWEAQQKATAERKPPKPPPRPLEKEVPATPDNPSDTPQQSTSDAKQEVPALPEEGRTEFRLTEAKPDPSGEFPP